MWAGSVRNGLINIKEVGMKTYQDVLPGQNYGLSEKTILSIYQDHDNQIWIGTDGGESFVYDRSVIVFHCGHNSLLPDCNELPIHSLFYQSTVR